MISKCLFLISFIFILLIRSVSAYYVYYTQNQRISKLLSDESKDVKIRITNASSDSYFPLEFECDYVDSNDNIVSQTFILIDGLINKPSTVVNVFTMDTQKRQYRKITPDKNLRIESYRSVDGTAVATLIENKDLFDDRALKSQRFRALVTTYNNNTKEEYQIIPYVIDVKTFNTDGDVKIERKLNHKIFRKNRFNDNFNSDSIEINDPNSDSKTSSFVKRNVNKDPISLFVEAAIVADHSAFLKHQGFLNTNDVDLCLSFMKIYYSHVINGVNQRYINAFKDNTDFKIEVRLSNVVIQTSPELWSNSSIYGSPEYPIYNGKEVLLATPTLYSFRAFMQSQSFPFSYDHAFAIIDKDLWSDNNTSSPAERSGVAGSSWVGGVCGSYKFSVIEDFGFNSILTMAHELGHNLGSSHDGVESNRIASACPASDSYIMTPVNGADAKNIENYYKFSNCSIEQFKSTLLNSNSQIKLQYGCLANVPIETPMESLYYDSYLTGQLFDANQQCKLIIGANSTQCVSLNVCETIFCRRGNVCTSIRGWGAIEGTSCGTNQVCKQGICVPDTITALQNLSTNPCLRNPCLNGGTCIQTARFYICKCNSNYLGLNCDIDVNGYTDSSFSTTTDSQKIKIF